MNPENHTHVKPFICNAGDKVYITDQGVTITNKEEVMTFFQSRTFTFDKPPVVEEKPPTAWAYEQVCKANENKRVKIDKLEEENSRLSNENEGLKKSHDERQDSLSGWARTAGEFKNELDKQDEVIDVLKKECDRLRERLTERNENFAVLGNAFNNLEKEYAALREDNELIISTDNKVFHQQHDKIKDLQAKLETACQALDGWFFLWDKDYIGYENKEPETYERMVQIIDKTRESLGMDKLPPIVSNDRKES